MTIWFEIPTKSGVVKIEVPELPASVGSDPSAEVRLRHPSVAAFHALIHASEDGISISGILPSNKLTYEGDDYRSIRLDDGDRIKIGEVPLLVRIEEEEAEAEDQDEAEDLAFDDTDDDSTAIADDDDEPEDEESEDGAGNYEDEESREAEGAREAESGDGERQNDAEQGQIAWSKPASGRRPSKQIGLGRLAPDGFEREFLDDAGQFQDWLTPFERETIVSEYLIQRLCDWRLRGLVEPEGDVPIPTNHGDTSAIPPPSRTLFGTQRESMDGQADAYCCLECGACRGDAVHMQIYACCEQIAVPLPTSPRTRLAQANKVKVFSIGACGRCAAFATTSLRPPANLSARMPFLIHEWDMRGVEERLLNDVSPGSRIVDLRCREDAGPGRLRPYRPDGYRQTVWVHRMYKEIIEWSASMLIREQVASRVQWRHWVESVSEQLELRIRRLERRGQLSSRATDPETGATLQQTLMVGRKVLKAFSASLPSPTSSDERSP